MVTGPGCDLVSNPILLNGSEFFFKQNLFPQMSDDIHENYAFTRMHKLIRNITLTVTIDRYNFYDIAEQTPPQLQLSEDLFARAVYLVIGQDGDAMSCDIIATHL